MKKNKKFIKFIKKYCYFIIPIPTIFILTILYSFQILRFPDSEDFLSTLVGTAGALIGFLFTAMTIFFSLNKNTEYMKNFKKYGHDIIFGRLITFGIIFLCINIIFWLFNLNQHITIISFVLGLEETVMAAYYTYKLSLNSFK